MVWINAGFVSGRLPVDIVHGSDSVGSQQAELILLSLLMVISIPVSAEQQHRPMQSMEVATPARTGLASSIVSNARQMMRARIIGRVWSRNAYIHGILEKVPQCVN